MDPGTPSHVCQNIAHTGVPVKSGPSAYQGVSSGPTPSTTSSPGHGPSPCRRQGRGQLAAPGLREKLALHVAQSLRCQPGHRGSGTTPNTHEPPDAHPQNTSNGPSCPCPSRCATTAQAVVPLLSGRHSPSTGSNPCPHDAPVTAWSAASTRRCNTAGLAQQCLMTCRHRVDQRAHVVNA